MGAFIDLVGQKFGKLKVIQKHSVKNKRIMWKCQCDCGKIKNINGHSLRWGHTRSCGCFSNNLISEAVRKRYNLQGKQFDRWTVLSFSFSNKKHSYWKCQCNCINKTERDVMGSDLTCGKSRSCGCINQEEFGKRIYKHGFSKNIYYNMWIAFNDRCYNPKADEYHNYGGRGIDVDKLWRREKFGGLPNNQGLINFLKWCDKNPRPGSSKIYSLDRINNNAGYSPENVRWATTIEQRNNKRKILKNSEVEIVLREKDNKIKNLQKELRNLKKIYGL